MSYQPSPAVATILKQAFAYVQSVPYQVGARWVFYRLLQDGTLDEKNDYKRLLGYLSQARKQFYAGWTPWTLTDDTRAAVLAQRTGWYTLAFRSGGFISPQTWLDSLISQINCPLDPWTTQDSYGEVWFEAGAMQAQFEFYADPTLPLLAFHGDVSIPAKWEAAQRLVDRWLEGKHRIEVFYYGDLDKKGLSIPESAEADIQTFIPKALYLKLKETDDGVYDEQAGNRAAEEAIAFMRAFHFTRVGINQPHVSRYNIPENPERPGTYQWEGLSDEGARELIAVSNRAIEKEKLAARRREASDMTATVRAHLKALTEDLP